MPRGVTARPTTGVAGRPITDELVVGLARVLDADLAAVVLIDGPSGSGKSTLAAAVADRVAGVEVVHTDELAPGWDGLAAASALVPAVIAGEPYRVWDWEADAPGALRRREPGRPLIVEGCGALTPAAARAASLRVWVDADDDTRKTRALERDPYYAAQWERWADQEADHWRQDAPWLLSDLVVRG